MGSGDTSPGTYRPLFADEVSLPGDTFEHTIEFTATDDSGGTKTFNDQVCIYVPASVRLLDSNQVGAEHKVLIFFTATRAVTDTKFDDTLIHGLRAPAETNGFVLISLPAPGDHIGQHALPASKPDFCVFRDQDISDCFLSAKLKGKPGTIFLASHSRGHRGLTRTLMGNDRIGEKNLKERDPNKATIGTPFIDLRKIERIIYLDNFFASGQRIMASLLTRGLSTTALRVYHFTDGYPITDNSIFQDKTQQFFDLQPTLSQSEGAAMGSLRYISEAIIVNPTFDNRDTKLAEKIFQKKDLLRILFEKRLPIRGTFSSKKPIPPNMMEVDAWKKNANLTPKEQQTLLSFLNNEHLLRTEFQFSVKIGAHHFFPCEFAHEFYE